tara:strand:+ start:531 stop:641 length:111 start_codon:yes stop_codon:yes gene_type:complete
MDRKRKNLVTAALLIVFIVLLFLATFYNIGIYNREL